MEKLGWKILAIVFMCLFATWVGIGIYVSIQDSAEFDKMNICYYDICEEYADAGYSNNVCSCYDYDMLGYLNIEKTEYMD